MAVERSERTGVAASATETTLLAAIAMRDARAFEELYRLHKPPLERFVVNLVGRAWLVEEVVNDTMMVIWHRPDSYRGGSRFSTWLFAIAYRKAQHARRRQDVPVEDRRDDQLFSDVFGLGSDLEAGAVRPKLQTALSALSVDHRTVVDLTYFHELSYHEIAEIMACPVDTVKTRMYHARRHLRRMLTGGISDWL